MFAAGNLFPMSKRAVSSVQDIDTNKYVRRDFMRLTEGSSDRRPGIRLLIVMRLSLDLSCDLSFHRTNERLDMSSRGEMEELGMLT